MGIVSTAVPAQSTPETDDLVQVYKALVDAMRKSSDPGFDRVRYNRLEIKVDALWAKLPRKQQLIAVDRLIESGHMPPKLAEILKMVSGTIATDEEAKKVRMKK